MKASFLCWGPSFVGRGLAFFFVGLLLAGTSSAQEMRTWSDATGQFKIQAKLQSVSDGKVTLVREDGSAVQIELSKLSAEDQKYAASQQANPFKPVEASPFKPVPSAAPIAPAATADPAAPAAVPGGEPRMVTVDWMAAEMVPMMPPQAEWKLEVLPSEKPAAVRNRAVPIPAKIDFFEKTQALVVNQAGNRALLGYLLEHRNQDQTRLVLADLNLGRALALKPIVGVKMSPLALSDSGTEVLMRSVGFGFGKADRLELWRISAGGIARVQACVPEAEKDVKWAAFLDAERFATLSSEGKLAIWNTATFQPQRQLKVDGGVEPALSPDRKYLAFTSGEQVGVLETASGSVAAIQGTPRIPFPKLSFSPDGAKLACVAFDKILVWNVADGSLYRDITLSGQNIHADRILWLRDQYLLVGRNSVFDIENQVRLWTLDGHDQVEKCGAACVFAVSPHGKPGAMIVATVPSPNFDAAMAKAMQAPDFFVLKQGTTVKLNVDGLPDAGEKEKAREALTKKLQEQGFQVGQEGTIELVASVDGGKERDVAYGSFMSGPFGPGRNYKVRDFVSHVKFVYQGKTVWGTQASSVPGSISLKDGETVEQVLRRNEKPSYWLFGHVELPKVLLKPMGPGGLGSSKVTVAGIQ